ncbi:MAG: amino acid permease [Veillonella sp.]|nr:amino acid permease [Veillonella sp.]
MSEEHDLKRGLKNRHVQLLAIGGAIGTGLFLGSGRSIHLAGPSILLSYIITGLICFFLMRALGELLMSNLEHHSFIDFVEDYLGEIETSAGPSTFSNLWNYGGWFPNGLWGFILSFQMVVFSFAGIELVGLTAGETENPKRVIPMAINNIPLRIILFYVGALAIIMSIYPWVDVNPAQSPFVMVFQAIGIVMAGSIVNFVVLTSAASATNSGIFSTSRMIYALAKRGHAPHSMRRLTNSHVPYQATIFSAAVLLITVVLNYIMPESVFVMITSISTFCFIYIWAVMIYCHMKYREKRPDLVKASTFKMPLYPVMNYLILAFFAFILVVLALNEDTRIALLFTPVWFVILWALYSMLHADAPDPLEDTIIDMAGTKDEYKKRNHQEQLNIKKSEEYDDYKL